MKDESGLGGMGVGDAVCAVGRGPGGAAKGWSASPVDEWTPQIPRQTVDGPGLAPRAADRTGNLHCGDSGAVQGCLGAGVSSAGIRLVGGQGPESASRRLSSGS